MKTLISSALRKVDAPAAPLVLSAEEYAETKLSFESDRVQIRRGRQQMEAKHKLVHVSRLLRQTGRVNDGTSMFLSLAVENLDDQVDVDTTKIAPTEVQLENTEGEGAGALPSPTEQPDTATGLDGKPATENNDAAAEATPGEGEVVVSPEEQGAAEFHEMVEEGLVDSIKEVAKGVSEKIKRGMTKFHAMVTHYNTAISKARADLKKASKDIQAAGDDFEIDARSVLGNLVKKLHGSDGKLGEGFLGDSVKGFNELIQFLAQGLSEATSTQADIKRLVAGANLTSDAAFEKSFLNKFGIVKGFLSGADLHAGKSFIGGFQVEVSDEFKKVADASGDALVEALNKANQNYVRAAVSKEGEAKGVEVPEVKITKRDALAWIDQMIKALDKLAEADTGDKLLQLYSDTFWYSAFEDIVKGSGDLLTSSAVEELRKKWGLKDEFLKNGMSEYRKTGPGAVSGIVDLYCDTLYDPLYRGCDHAMHVALVASQVAQRIAAKA